jgi:hypothetical protein
VSKRRPFSFKKRKVGWVVLGLKISGEKGGVGRCLFVTQQFSTQLPQNVTAVCGIGCLACQDEFFMNNSLDVK